MHPSRYYRNPAVYQPRPNTFGPTLSQMTRSTYKRSSVTPFSPHKRSLNIANTFAPQHPTYANPRFPDRSKYVWTANKPQSESSQVSSSTSQTSQVPSTGSTTHIRTVEPQIKNIPSQIKNAPPQVKNVPPQVKNVPPQIKNAPPQIKNTPSQVRNVAPPVIKNTPPLIKNVVPPQIKKLGMYHREISPLSVTVLDPVEQIIVDIAQKLKEQKVYIIKKVVDVIGAKKAIKLFYATRQKEADGGILIQNGRRRRTPGGVFLSLLKELDIVPKQDAKKVFLEIKRYESQLHQNRYR